MFDVVGDAGSHRLRRARGEGGLQVGGDMSGEGVWWQQGSSQSHQHYQQPLAFGGLRQQEVFMLAVAANVAPV